MPERPTKKANPTDAHVGQRVRARRLERGMSQEALGDALGLTFQQVQKYEKGANRIGASRLQDISRILGVPPAYFFDGAPGNGSGDKAQEHSPITKFMAEHSGAKFIEIISRLPKRSRTFYLEIGRLLVGLDQ